MKNILLLDTSVATLNKGDEIIMECVREELQFLTKNNFVINLPTHISPFHSYQIWRNSNRVKVYKNADYKFVGGTNLLIPNMLTHFPQWNLNIFNYKAVAGCVLVGVGAGAGEKTNKYTKHLYKKLLNHEFFHSARDERSRQIMENYGVKALNTGCVTMWKLTPEFCKQIPTKKADRVVFTLTSSVNKDEKDQELIDILLKNYKQVYFWPQGIDDYDYFKQFNNIDDIILIDSDLKTYDKLLNGDNLDYVGTRLHGGVYAMRHKKRTIIISIDERAREINKCNNLNCIEKSHIQKLDELINSEFTTEIRMPYDEINKWKNQFHL
jgi:polysaccharide pyruvyl transferase WcaK-like protein